MSDTPYDLLIIGGGINGCGIARDAAGRGLRVLLVEQDDLASHTSSASTKLIHGGLRYLEYYEFRLVREALIERERLWAIAPHIIKPLEFLIPLGRSKRPGWLVRIGLFLYDHLGGRKRLPATRTVKLAGSSYGAGLDPALSKGFVYADCWVDDARLVVLNAMDAREHGADILTRTKFVSARRDGNIWIAELKGGRQVHAHVLVNAAGPWVGELLGTLNEQSPGRNVRLVKGSHIVVPRLYQGDHALLLENPDGRVVFAIPYQDQFTLIGTTDEAWSGGPGKVDISDTEAAYLCEAANRYFERQIATADVVWSYAGIRPLYDDHAANASAVTRDYVLDLDLEGDGGTAPLLSIFGGKITTYRRLAEHALEKLAPWFARVGKPWTASAPLPGGDFADLKAFTEEVQARWPNMPSEFIQRLTRSYGTRMDAILGDAQTPEGLGADYGNKLYQAEIDYLTREEWAQSAEDILWRRTKLGLSLSAEEQAELSRNLATSH